MPMSVTAANAFLNLILRAQGWANYADNAASGPVTNNYIGLHTADPGTGGSQLTSEATYGAYARLAIARTTGGWDAPASGATDNTALQQFAECTSGSNVITHVTIGQASSGAGLVLWAGALSASRTISTGIQPQFAAGALTVTQT